MIEGETAWEMARDSLKEAYLAIFELITINLLWVALSLPIVTAPAAAAGLYYANNQLAHEKPTTWHTFFEGFRMYWQVGLRWFLVNIVVLPVLGYNIWFYGLSGQVSPPLATWMAGLFLVLTILWLVLGMYIFPLLLEQERPLIGKALRNSIVMVLRQPRVAAGLFFGLALLVALSTLLQVPWVLFSASLMAYLENRIAIYVIKKLKAVDANRPA